MLQQDVLAEEQGVADKLKVSVGDWVEEEYNTKRYPGEVLLVGREDVQVSVLHRQFAQNWKWPSRPDKIFYKFSSIFQEMCQPEPVGKGDRMQFKFKEIP